MAYLRRKLAAQSRANTLYYHVMADGCGYRAEYEDLRHHTRACVLCVSWKCLPTGARSAALK
eukprot:scaffold6359_cov84-Skeletonema_dohrnii-CCMP3373.AAC.3